MSAFETNRMSCKYLSHPRIATCLFSATIFSLFMYAVIESEYGGFKLIEDESSVKAPGPYFFQVQTEIQLKRKNQVIKVCKGLNNTNTFKKKLDPSGVSTDDEVDLIHLNPTDFHALFYDDSNKIIYCEVPKVACSNWKRVLLMLSGKVKAKKLTDMPVNEVHSYLSRSYLKRMDKLSLPGILRRLDPSSGYFKFLFVRDPYERLLSAYRNKFVASYSHYFHKRFGRYIIRRYRGVNASNDSLARGHDATFPEFIRFSLEYLYQNCYRELLARQFKIVRFATNKDEVKMGRKMNAHWRPVSELCLPCLVKYNFIGRYENMDRGDVLFVLDRLNARHLSFPPAYHNGSNKTESLLREHYYNVPNQDIEDLKITYKEDFEMFYPGNTMGSLLKNRTNT